MVEELDNKYIDNTLNDIKTENETEETKIKKPSKNTKKTLHSKAETKTTKSRPKNKKTKTKTKTKTTTTKEIESEEEEAKSEEESQKFESLRKEKFVEYDEADYTLREISIQDQQILIGPKRITRFEKARITGARALQISFGAPVMIKVDVKSRSSISIAIEELETKSLPISIRRILPNGLYQDVPLEWLKT